MKKILELEPSNDQARKNIVRLEPLAREKMEKMKEEMMGDYFFVLLPIHSFILAAFRDAFNCIISCAPSYPLYSYVKR